VPDPYYGGPRGFDDVFAMIRRSAEELLDHLAP
jgi:protein-tyrosine-phosphatase